MYHKITIITVVMLLVAACQQTAAPIGGAGQDFGAAQGEGGFPPTQSQNPNQQMITERDLQGGNQRFSGFGSGRVQQQQPFTPQQQGGFNFFNQFSSVDETKVALLVPLSGKFKSLGEAMLNSASLAVFFLNEPNVSLIPIDTKGTPFGAKSAAEQAVASGAKIILGPVFSRSAKAAIKATDGSGVHIISFSNDKTLQDSGIFTIGFRPEQEIQRIVAYALQNNIYDFTTLLPNNNYGASVAETLRVELDNSTINLDRASVDASGEFTTSTMDATPSLLRNEIFYVDGQGKARNLSKHTMSAMNAALSSRAERDYIKEEKRFSNAPIQFPRGMLIPEGGARLETILGYVKKSRKFNPNKVKLLGSALWAEGLPQNSLLEGAWFAAADINKQRAFEAHYERMYHKKAPTVAGLAYDSVALAVALARMSNGRDFSREAITNPRGFVGVSGIFRLEANGLVTRGLAVMEVQNGQPVVIEPAPTRFFNVKG